MKLDKPFGLPAVLGAVTPTTEDKNHWMRPLQFGELPAFRGVVEKLIVGEGSPRDDVGPHVNSSTVGCAVAKLRLAAGALRATQIPRREESTKASDLFADILGVRPRFRDRSARWSSDNNDAPAPWQRGRGHCRFVPGHYQGYTTPLSGLYDATKIGKNPLTHHGEP